MSIEDAAGAVSRGRQLIVVAEDADTEEETESLLTACLDAGMPRKPLRRQTAPEDGVDPLTGLHEDVMRELKILGYDSVPSVEAGPWRVDIGVPYPKQAGRYLLGILFDGPMCARIPTARDRERLRPEALARLGWTLHRIGSLDWTYRKQEESVRLRQALSSTAG